jgi:hypothetical protein
MIGIANAEQWKWSRPERLARTPIEAERATLRIDIFRRLPAEYLFASGFDVRATGRIVLDLHLVDKVGLGRAVRHIRRRALLRVDAKQ